MSELKRAWNSEIKSISGTAQVGLVPVLGTGQPNVSLLSIGKGKLLSKTVLDTSCFPAASPSTLEVGFRGPHFLNILNGRIPCCKNRPLVSVNVHYRSWISNWFTPIFCFYPPTPFISLGLKIPSPAIVVNSVAIHRYVGNENLFESRENLSEKYVFTYKSILDVISIHILTVSQMTDIWLNIKDLAGPLKQLTQRSNRDVGIRAKNETGSRAFPKVKSVALSSICAMIVIAIKESFV